MANSLSEWLVDKVSSCIASREVGVFSDQQDTHGLVGDIPFVKGLGVQILHFYTPQVARKAHQELNDSYHRGLVSHQYTSSYDPVREAASSSIERDDIGPLCAIVADKAHRVHVQFSRHCVARFDSTHSRPLISLRGSLIHIKSFRPSVSFLASFLDNVQRRDGPFGAVSPLIKPVLFLEIESMQVLGAINEVQFWNDKELESTLLDDNTPSTPFKIWYKQVARSMMKSQKHRRQIAEEEALKLNGSESKKRMIAKSGSESETSAAITASMPMPPPYQRPIAERPRHPDTSQESGSTTSSKKSKREEWQGAWGDFTLTQGDEFGLEAAASQWIESRERGVGSSFEGQMTADSLDTHAIFPSLSIDENNPDSSGNLQDDASRSSRLDGDASQGSREGFSQNSTLPATYSILQEEEEEKPKSQNQDDIGPPSVTNSTSLPFSLGVSTGIEAGKAVEDEDSSLDASRTTEEQEKVAVETLAPSTTQKKPKRSMKEMAVSAGMQDNPRYVEVKTSPLREQESDKVSRQKPVESPPILAAKDRVKRYDFFKIRIPTPEVLQSRDEKARRLRYLHPSSQ